MFRSLRVANYRLWFAGALVSNTGAWMQRTAQDWIVLTELTDQDAAALGVTMALQFGPLLLLMPVSGIMADRFDRRRLLMWTQGLQGALALGLGLLVVTGAAQLWHVYVFALLLGIVTAIDAPARQSFVSDLVRDDDLQNAVALNGLSFHGARLIGPAIAGVLITLVGSGVVFLINAGSFVGVIAALVLIRRASLHAQPRLGRGRGAIRDGLRYIGARPDILVVLIGVFLIGTFGFNFPLYISTMANVEFGQDADVFGVLSSVMAAGAVAGSLVAAVRQRARYGVIVGAAAAFGVASALAAISPSVWTFGASLVLVGAASLTMMNTANAYVQTTTEPAMRGRVMAVYLAIFAGGTPIGAPIAGWLANAYGPRWALVLAAASGIVAAAVGVVWLVRSKGMRVTRDKWRLGLSFSEPERTDRELATQEIAIVESTARRTS